MDRFYPNDCNFRTSKRETLNFDNSKLRQLGDQENNIVSMVKNITKFSYILKNPNYLDDIISKALKNRIDWKTWSCLD